MWAGWRPQKRDVCLFKIKMRSFEDFNNFS